MRATFFGDSSCHTRTNPDGAREVTGAARERCGEHGNPPPLRWHERRAAQRSRQRLPCRRSPSASASSSAGRSSSSATVLLALREAAAVGRAEERKERLLVVTKRHRGT